ncbi:GNAT family N-acetyltransferase [Mangrovibacillus cuniculi]|uniref:GNAT family N-acetyltransferase n=2 Tax=Mangrovibacillus cuniculi TaxID=2593652 RepID=A0A7S8CE48_9BACI|nr:GNAT family N-acetyltransferase [Mangrovibacillus cuniculi]QPC48310.1 GNAT family N-acetyltransferase [Mangrovibacillus cuniculi]
MTITYEINKPILAKDLASLFKKSTINRPIEDEERLDKMLQYADLTVTAWDRNTLVGISRSVTDFVYCCYLSDLAVDEAYQKKGIGKELVRLTKEELGEQVSLILLSAPTAMDYYPKIGMEMLDNGFAIRRER